MHTLLTVSERIPLLHSHYPTTSYNLDPLV